MKNALTAAGMTILVTRTSRFRKIWTSSLRAIESMAKVLFLEFGSGLVAAEGAEELVKPGRPGFEFPQFHRVVLRPAEQGVQVLLQPEGLDEEFPVTSARGLQR